MGLRDWFGRFFDKKNVINTQAKAGSLAGDIFYKELAINSAVNLIANTLSNAEFLTFHEGKEVKKDNYYLFNVEPNLNTSANKFWREVVYKLVRDNECLVVFAGGGLHIADSYDVEELVFKENTYKNIIVKDYPLKSSFRESQVFHLRLHNEKMIDIVSGLYESYGLLIASAEQHNMRKRAKRGTLEIPGSYPQTEAGQESLQNLLQNNFKTYFEANSGAVLPLSNGLKYNENSDNLGNNPSQEGRDIRAFIDDVFDFVALALNIPPQLLKGDVADTEKAFKNFITFCIKPLADMITDEINRKYYGKADYLKGSKVELDVSRVEYTEIASIANALDVLLRSGANTINDNLRILGREPINEPWADERFITKNYEPVKKALEGGD